MSAVVLRALTKIYPRGREGDVFAVRQIDLEVREGELMALVGPSGCGKSSLLRMIAGLDSISEGTIEIDGVIVNQTAPNDRNVAMVFQNYALFPYMTVYENMAFGLKYGKISRNEIRRRVTDAAEVLHLSDYLDRKPKELSGGQRQRVAVGRAMVCEPKVFLFDEPLSNLDAKMRTQMRAEIAKLHRRLRTTVIYVTHDQTEAMTLGERICVMNLGQVMQVGTPLEVYHEPRNRFVADFVGSPGMNFLAGNLVRDGREFFFRLAGEDSPNCSFPVSLKQFEMAGTLVGRDLELGIRPEEIQFISAGTESNVPDCVTAKVDYCEPLGHETLVYLRVGSASLVARILANKIHPPTGSVQIRLNRDRMKLVNPSTQQILS